MTIDGLTQRLQNQANEAMLKLSQTLEMEHSELFKQELGPALKSMKMECEDWTSTTLRVNVFATLLARSGHVLGYYPDLVISIFTEVLTKEPIEPELKLKLFLSLAKLLKDLKNNLDSQDNFKDLAFRITSDLILPSLKWQAGKKAEAVRISAVSALWGIFASKSLEPQKLWQSPNFANKLVASMNRCVEDDAVKIRLFICQSFKFLFDQSGLLIPLESLAKIVSLLMKRLDDVNDDVRVACLQALSAVTNCLPDAALNQLQINKVYNALLLHMDDSNEKIRSQALGNINFFPFF